MKSNPSDPLIYEFAPTANYIFFLWIFMAVIQFGLVYLYWMSRTSPWYGRESMGASFWTVGLLIDGFLLVGVLYATFLRVRVDDAGISYLSVTFRRARMDWDAVTRLERKTNFLGSRYFVKAGRRTFGFTTASLCAASRLAALIVERADLDDLGEVGMSVQAGTIHVWQHPSVADDPL